MLKKAIKYTDYNGKEHTEDFYFNLSSAELAEMELSVKGGYAEMITSIVEAEDTVELITIFKDLILKSYGKKSDDGKRFIKSKELSEEFSQMEAYSELFMELASDADAASAFVNGIIPEKTKLAINQPK